MKTKWNSIQIFELKNKRHIHTHCTLSHLFAYKTGKMATESNSLEHIAMLHW